MNTKQQFFWILNVIFLCISGISASYGATRISTASGGNWSSTATWSGGNVPSVTDSVIITAGASVTVDSDFSCLAIYFGSGASCSLTIGSMNTLTVTNDITYSNPSSNSTQTLAIGNGNVLCRSLVMASTSQNSRVNMLTISTGIFTASRNISMPGSSARNVFSCSGPAKVTVGGTWTNAGNIVPGTATFEYNGSSSQSVLALTYAKLVLAGSGNKTLAGTVAVSDTLTISAGATLNNSGSTNLTVSGVFYILGTYVESNTGGSVTFNGLVYVGGTFNSSVGENFTFNNGFVVNGTFISGTGTYTFGSNAQIIGGMATKSFAGNVTINTTVTNYDSLMVAGTFSGSGTFINATDSSYLQLNGSSVTVSGLTATAPGNTVVYGRNGTQTVKAATYYNLGIQNTGTKTAGGTVTVNGNLSIASGIIFDMGTSALAGAALTTGGTGTLTTQNVSPAPLPAGRTWSFSVSYNSSSAQPVVSGNYSSLNGTGANRTLSSTGVIGISGVFTTGTGAYTVTSSTVDFNGSNQGIPAFTFNNLVCSNSGIKTGSAITVNGQLSVAGGVTLNMGTNTLSGASVTSSGTGTLITSNTSAAPIPAGRTWSFDVSYASASAQTVVNGSYTNLAASGGNRTLSTAGINIAGSFTPGSGTYTVTNSTVNFDGSSQNIPAFTFNNLMLSGSRTKTLTGAAVVGGVLTFNTATDTLSLAGNTLTLNGTIAGTGSFTGSNTSSLVINGSGNAGVIKFAGGTGLQNLTLNRTASGALSLGSDLAIAAGGALSLSNGALLLNGFSLTLSGDLAATTGTLSGSSSSGLIVSGTGTLTSSLVFTAGSATLGTFVMNRAAGVLTLGSDLSITNASFANGSLALNGKTLTIGGIVTTTAGSIAGSNTSSVSITGSGAAGTLAFSPGASVLNTLSVNRTGAGSITLGSDLTLAGGLTLASGMLNIGSNTLTLNGTFSGSSGGGLSCNGSGSNITISGAGTIGNLFFDQAIPGTTNRVNNLTLNRSGQTVTLSNALQITGAFIPSAGTLATGNMLTLVSNAAGTARVAAGSGSYITGSVTVERYIPGISRRWRFIGSPVSNTTLADLQGEMYITGTGGAANGFDATSSNSPSVYSYDETLVSGDLNTGWTAATNITNMLATGKGYRLFVRGDRSDPGRLAGTNSSQNAVTVNVSGVLNTGNIALPVSYSSSGIAANDGWNLVSNPYASPFDWNAFYDSQNGTANCQSIDPTIYVLNASSNSYDFYNAVSNAGTLTNGIIPPFAAFFVKAVSNSPAPALVFSEPYKTSAVPVNMFKTSENEGLCIRLEADSISFDKMVIKYMNGASVNKDLYDVAKLGGAWVNISAYGADSMQLSASVRPPASGTDTIRLNVKATTTGNYRLVFGNSNDAAIQEQVLLFDNYAGTITDLGSTPAYLFTVNTAVAASQGMGRFYIVIGNRSSLPVKLTSFAAAAKEDRTTRIYWSTASEINSDYFGVERSVNGKDYECIGYVPAAGNTSLSHKYEFIDARPAEICYYRIRQADKTGSFTYSPVCVVRMEQDADSRLILFPVPVVSSLSMQLNTSLPIASCFITDAGGNTVYSRTQEGGALTVALDGLKTGVYWVTVTDKEGHVYKRSIVKQ
jgi:hypothetical protein